MSGSLLGKRCSIMTWGESHGVGVGVVIDGVPSGLDLSIEDIQQYLDRRKPGQSQYTTKRDEGDKVEILSGVFEGRTTGTPISLMVHNCDQHSKDYSDLASAYRPGHADYTFDEKFGFRDYRGGGRSSGRETIGRVAAGAIASLVLSKLGISLLTYTKSVGMVEATEVIPEYIMHNSLYMPEQSAYEAAKVVVEEAMQQGDSVGGVVECIVRGMPAGIGNPVFDKLDANLAKAMLSIGAAKGFEMGDGFEAAKLLGSQNNDAFCMQDKSVMKRTNHSGGVLGGMSDGSDLIFRVAFKPTPSISKEQQTITSYHEETTLVIKGRHDPIIVPRAVVVVESMAAITILDLLLDNMGARIEDLENFYQK